MKVDDVVSAYVKLRDMKSEMERQHKDQLAPIKDKMQTVEGWLQKHLLAAGVESFKTKAGTAYLQTFASATVKDWPATLDFIKENEEWAFIDARVNKTAVKSWIEDKGDVPPGVDYKETIVVRVRR